MLVFLKKISGNERRRDGYKRLMNNFEQFLNQQWTTQERLSNGYRTAVDRIRTGHERLSNRSVPEDKNGYWKITEKNDKHTIKKNVKICQYEQQTNNKR